MTEGLLALGATRFLADMRDAIAALLSPEIAARCALVDATPPACATSFLDLPDAEFEQGFLTPALDLADHLQSLPPGRSSILLLGSLDHLGEWHAVPAAALSGFAIGLTRSLVLERMGAGLVVNMIAFPRDRSRLPDGWIGQAAQIGVALLTGHGINGHVLPFDGGANLRMTKARRR
ncbi:short-chain dehydrogenase [Rhizorhabdus phycosphaerae]|uniref:short-chain dehydrogenase n=1 Tax=Rhizorhabdus phycosphaerae TaxID=2711156 RepID=UPI0013EAB70F|nr:short-chain dehydrogenase [Rhizorhabdus phycosphaerae]